MEFKFMPNIHNIVYNAIRTPDGTVLESRHRHDYVEYTDENGYEYMVDGGLEYLRRGWTPDAPDYKELSLGIDDPHGKVREHAKWGTYGPNGDQPLKFVTIKEMSTDHINACLENVPSMSDKIRTVMENELTMRELPPVPKGMIYLGMSGDFNPVHVDIRACFLKGDEDWMTWEKDVLDGDGFSLHYAGYISN